VSLNFQPGDLVSHRYTVGEEADILEPVLRGRLATVIKIDANMVSDGWVIVRLVWLDNGRAGRKYPDELRLVSRAHKEKIEFEGTAN
jgi:hypothetical protein